jgi:hypothetical protein
MRSTAWSSRLRLDQEVHSGMSMSGSGVRCDNFGQSASCRRASSVRDAGIGTKQALTGASTHRVLSPDEASERRRAPTPTRPGPPSVTSPRTQPWTDGRRGIGGCIAPGGTSVTGRRRCCARTQRDRRSTPPGRRTSPDGCHLDSTGNDLQADARPSSPCGRDPSCRTAHR